MALQNNLKEKKNMSETHLVSPVDSLEGGGRRNGSVIRREGGSASGRETPVVNKKCPCVFRGPEDCRRVFLVLEVAPRGLGSRGNSGRKRAESG